MADFSSPQSNGGQSNAAVAAGSGAADVVVSAAPGRVCKVVIIAAGSAALKLYDHATATSGAKLIWASPATTVAGDQYTLDIPVANGIVALQASGSPLAAVTYGPDGPLATTKGRALPTSVGGNATSYHAAGAGGASAASAGSGRLCRICVMAQGTVVTNIYDNASAASGTKIWTIPASGTTAVASGTMFDVQVPVANGIFVGGAANTSECLVTYATDAPFGR